MCSANPHLARSGFQRAPRSLSYDSSTRVAIYSVALRSKSLAKSCRVEILHPRCNIRRRFTFPIAVMDDDSVDIPSFFEEGDEISGDIASYVWSSSEGEESDTDLLVSLPPDVDLPMRRELAETHDAAVTVTVHRLATLQKGQRNNRKLLVPLPPPFGLVYLGRFYLVLTAFCFVSVGNGVRLIDGSDGLAGGSAALAFVGMSVAVLAICPDLSIFGASMAGACIGFLFHSRYKSSIYMGEIGSLALGGALVAMAACTGMFLPLFISSGVFLLELLSVVVQVLYMAMAMRHKYQAARRFIRMAPLHQLLRLYVGLRGPLLVGVVYIVSFGLSLAAGYVGLISA